MHSFLDGITRPMLAYKLTDINKVKLPCFVQSKEDGIRCFMLNDVGLSRAFKPLPNKHIQRVLRSAMLPDGLDGEIITLDKYGNDKPFNDIQSDVMSVEGEPTFVYRVFDLANNNSSYAVRHKARINYTKVNSIKLWLQNVEEWYVTTSEALKLLEENAVAKGKEGIIIRDPHGFYKSGRSTLDEGSLLKLKRFEDAEAIVIGFEELQHNCNSAEQDNFGLTKRASCQDNLISGNKLGALIVRDLETNEQFRVGSGFTGAMRMEIWDHKEDYLHQIITYKYQKHGMKDKPRCPVFKGFRKD